MITVRLTGFPEAIATITSWTPAVQQVVRATVTRETIALQRHVVEDKLSGQVLHVRSGTLRRSITYTVDETGQGVVGTVGTNLAYARIHEYGGTINVPEIRPVRAKALHFNGIFAMRARAHVVVIPERSYLRSALADREPVIRESLASALQSALT